MPSPYTSNPLAYAATSFMGAKVRAFNTYIGWNMGGASQLNVSLVDDPVYNSYFSPPSINSPVYFNCGSLVFGGLFQKYEVKNDISGKPVYDVTVIDPREILDGAQVILSGYSGPVGGVSNLFNVFGFWESQGYGLSGATDAGMPWNKVAAALTSMANNPSAGIYGGPLTFGGTTYSLDLSQLPQAPEFYRISGVSVGLLELISQICEDGGCDFFVDLVGYTIRVRTTSRLSQPPLGTISAVANSLSANLVRSSSGLESRNELTSAFLVGGDVTTLWPTNNIRQFWGYDINGNVILGAPITVVMRDNNNKIIDSVATEQMNLNASPVSDILGAVSYQCTTLEMRIAQTGYASWAWYLQSQRPQIAKLIGMPIPFANNIPGLLNAIGIRPNIVNDNVLNAQLAIAGDAHDRGMRMYELVRGYADEYMGRKFLVGLPFILAATDPDTLKVTTNWEVTDGGYLDEGSSPLGVSPLNEDILKTQDGRFRAFVVFNNMNSADLTRLSPQGGFIQNNLLYQECQVDPQILQVDIPCVVATLPGVVTDRELNPQGNINILAWVLQTAANVAQQFLGKAAIPLKIAPATRSPIVCSVPLKSNVLTYGPWYASGAPGKVKFEQDSTLTPWTYGGISTMNLAGATRVNEAITNMQVCETGAIELAGPPIASLGDLLQTGGPNITAIDVAFGVDGIKTSYRFQTFTPRFGIFSKAQNERLKRVALAAVDLRRQLRAGLREQQDLQNVIADAARTRNAWRAKLPKAIKRETPSDVIIAMAEIDQDGIVRTNPSVATMEESIALSNASSSGDFQNTAMMSLGGLIRPFSTNPSGYAVGMPNLVMPYASGGIIADANTLNPFGHFNDVEVFAYGTSYQGCHALRRGVVGSDARVFGFKSPAIFVGWGFDINGNCTPGSGSSWRSDYLTNQANWNAGPIDPLWDPNRGVWTVHGSLKGITLNNFSAGASGSVTITPSNGNNYILNNVQNWWGAAVGNNTRVVLSYIPTDNLWYIIAADCAPIS